MYISQNIFDEIHKFLINDLIEENLSYPCRFKLTNLISKLETTSYQSAVLKKSETIYEDNNIYEEPFQIDSNTFNFELPKRQAKCSNDYENMTLLGPLYYRYNLQCWEHYMYSMLFEGRLVCCKTPPNSGHNISSSQLSIEKNSELSVFLMGYTAVMTFRDCGMNFVFKLTHPTEDTKVFATETAEEATIWIEQINQYAIGATPSEKKILIDNSNSVFDSMSETNYTSNGSNRLENFIVDDGNKIDENSHLRRQPSEVLNNINNSSMTPNFPLSDIRFNRSRSSYSFKTGNTYTQNNTLQNNNAGSMGLVGGTSIISSMRRKVESFGNKYRNRRSFEGLGNKSFKISSLPLSSSSTSNKIKSLQPMSSDSNNVASVNSHNPYPTSKDIIYSGIAKLRLKGNRMGWMERWCQLKPKLLECYHIQNSNTLAKPTLDFALCLEDLMLGLSNDRKHRSALRLSCDNVKQDLLFEIPDKILIGDWIKSFIEALGIGNNKKPIIQTTHSNSSSESHVRHSMDISIISNQSNMSDSIYDEVCSLDITDHDQLFVTPPTPVELRNKKLQILNSSPSQNSNRRCLEEHPLPTIPASSPDSENNFDQVTDADDIATLDAVYEVSQSFNRSTHKSINYPLSMRNKELMSHQNFASNEKLTIPCAGQGQDNNDRTQNGFQNESISRQFSDNQQHWRFQGCSLADLIARFEPENLEHSSATTSSKTDSSCTPNYHNSSEDNINSISNSFMSVHSVDTCADDSMKNVSRSVSADTDLSNILQKNFKGKKDRPKSLLMKKTSLELVLEELLTTKEDIANLRKQKNELYKAHIQKSNSHNESMDTLNVIISEINNQIKIKESRIADLSNHSKKRFTLEIVNNLTPRNS